MPERSSASASTEPVSAPAPASPPASGSAPVAIGGPNSERLVRRTISDVLGLGKTIYDKSPALVQAGVDNVWMLSRPVVTKVATKVNPLAQGLVDRLDDGVDTVASKLTKVNTTASTAAASVADSAQSGVADLKAAAQSSLSLVSKKWHTTVDSILVPLHPTLAANVYLQQASEQFKTLYAAVAARTAAVANSAGAGGVGGSSGATATADNKSASTAADDATTSVNAFVSRLRVSLSSLWDERLLPLSEAFYSAARTRYESGAKSADEALSAIKQTLGTQWNERVLEVFRSRVGTPSVDVYHRVLTKFLQLHDAQAPEIKSSAQFVAVIRASLGAVWTDSLKEPVIELYTALRNKTQNNADAVRAMAQAAQQQLNADSVSRQYTSLTTALQQQLHAVWASAEELSHWSLRRLYRTGTGLVTSAVDSTVQRSLQLSASAVDYLLPRAEGESPLEPASAADAAADQKSSTPDASSVAPTGDATAAAAPASAPLTLRVLGRRAASRVNQRVRARVNGAVTATRKAVSRADGVAADVSSRAATFVGVDVYGESKQLLARTTQLLASVQQYSADSAEQVQRSASAVQQMQLQRVRQALAQVNAEFARHTATVQALLQKLDSRVTGVPLVARTRKSAASAVSAIRARVAAAITRVKELAAKSAELSDQLLDAELAALPHDLLRLLRVLPTLLPAPVQSAGTRVASTASDASTTASAKLKSLLATLSEAVRAVVAYTSNFAGARRNPTPASNESPASSSSSSAAASASSSSSPSATGPAPGGLLGVPSSSSLSLTPTDSPTLTAGATPARPETPPPAESSAASSSSSSSAAAPSSSSSSSSQTPVKQMAAEYEAHVASAATPPVAQNGKRKARKSKAKKQAVAAAADDDESAPGAADE